MTMSYDLWERFLNSDIAVYLDKENPEQIEEFYHLIEDKEYGSPSGWNDSPLNYLLNEHSGPFHFIDLEDQTLNGARKDYVLSYIGEFCNVSDFLDQCSKHKNTNTDLEEEEYSEILFGVM